MARQADDFSALLAGGGVLLGLGLLAASAAESRRKQFERAVRTELEKDTLKLESLSLGRGKQNQPIWSLLVQRFGEPLIQVRVSLDAKADPYAPDVPQKLRTRVKSTLDSTAG